MTINTSKSPNESLYSLVGAILCISVLVWLRFPATQNGGFHNEDAAGIVYSARLLLAGGLPLVDTLELKAPGSFFLVAGVLKVFGDTLQSEPSGGSRASGSSLDAAQNKVAKSVFQEVMEEYKPNPNKTLPALLPSQEQLRALSPSSVSPHNRFEAVWPGTAPLPTKTLPDTLSPKVAQSDIRRKVPGRSHSRLVTPENTRNAVREASRERQRQLEAKHYWGPHHSQLKTGANPASSKAASTNGKKKVLGRKMNQAEKAFEPESSLTSLSATSSEPEPKERSTPKLDRTLSYLYQTSVQMNKKPAMPLLEETLLSELSPFDSSPKTSPPQSPGADSLLDRLEREEKLEASSSQDVNNPTAYQHAVLNELSTGGSRYSKTKGRVASRSRSPQQTRQDPESSEEDSEL